MMKLVEFKQELERLVQEGKSLLQSGELRKGKPEENTKQRLIRPLLELLGYSFAEEIVSEFKVQKKPRAEWVDYALLNDEDVPLLFIEAKSLYEDNVLNFQEEILGYLRNYSRPENKVNKEGFVVSWGVLTNFKELHFFHVGEKEPFLSLQLEEYKENGELIWNLLEKGNLRSDKIAWEYRERTKKELDKDFLSDLKKWRLIIANGFYQLQPNLSIEEVKEASQRWIDRLIFIRIFENQGLLPYHWIRKIYTSWQRDTINKEENPFSEEIRRKFREFESLYNTELFKPNLCDQLQIDNKFISEVIKVYEIPTQNIRSLFESMKQQASYAGIYGYNFNSLTLDVLGSIYERYLAHNIEIKNDTIVIEETRDLRKKEGVYYTPQYIIRFIVDKALKPKVEAVYKASKTLLDKGEYKAAYEKIREISAIKVLDPACGSGSFLIEAFDTIAKYYSLYNDDAKRQTEKIKKHIRGSSNLDRFSDMPIILTTMGEDILLSNLYGVDLDEQAVEITKLNLWRAAVLLEPEKYSFKGIAQNRKDRLLPSLENNIKCGNSIVDDFSVSKAAFEWQERFASGMMEGGFDVVIGNPPYGAELSPGDRRHLSEKYVTCKSYKNSALAFLERGYTLLKETGNLGFIVPKSLTFSQGWSEGVKLILPALRFLVDASKAFKEVLLEQVVVILNREKAGESYDSAVFEGDKVSTYVTIPKDTYAKSKILMTSIVPAEFEIYKKMNLQGHYFGNISKTFRGLPWQEHVGKSGPQKMFRGDHIERFGLKESLDFVDEKKIGGSTAKRNLLKQPKIISQNIVAHVQKPTPHIIVMSALDKNGHLNLDTVNNTVSTDKNYSLEYLLCVLNCRLTSWYAYRFIYNKAIRTMHFDDYYVGRIPIPRLVDQEQIVHLANKMTKMTHRKQTLLVSFWRLCQNRKNGEENLLWLLSNSSLVDATVSENINPKSWSKTKFDEFEINKSGKAVILKSSNSILMKIALRNPDLTLYTYFVLRYYQEQGTLGHRDLKGLCEYVKVPIIKPNPDVELKRQIVSELKRAHGDVDLSVLDEQLRETDKKIDRLLYDMYGLTRREIEIVEGEREID